MNFQSVHFRNVGAAVLVVLIIGCSGVSRMHDDIALKSQVEQAFKCEASAPSLTKYARHFERGWKQAYYNIWKGADPCPPSTPPEPYWSVKYQNADGCRMIAAWFEGYRRGVEAAQRDGRHLFSNVPIGSVCARESALGCEPTSPRQSNKVARLPPIDSEIR